MLFSVVIDDIKNNTNYPRYTGVSGRHHVKLLGYGYHQTGSSGSIINVFCPQLGNNTTLSTTTNTGAGRSFLSFLCDHKSFDHHYGVVDLGIRELNNYLDFSFTDTTATAARFVIYLDINDARTQDRLLN